MKKEKSLLKFRDQLTFRGAILTLASFLGSFIVGLGCMQQPNVEINYGAEYRRSEVAEALKSAMGESTTLDIKLNEFSLTDTTRVIRGRQVVDLLESTGMTVVKRQETPFQLQLNMVEEKLTYDLTDSHKNKRLVREYLDCVNRVTLKAEACVPVSTGEPLPTSVPEPTTTPQPTTTPVPTAVPTILPTAISIDAMVERSLELFSEFSTKSQEDQPRVSYHQLKVLEHKVSPPKQVIDSPNCGGIPGCLINVTEIEFDQVSWLAYNKGDKIHIKITTSKDVPYLSRVLEKCQQGSVAIKQEDKPESEWPHLLVTFCETIRNFKNGE